MERVSLRNHDNLGLNPSSVSAAQPVPASVCSYLNRNGYKLGIVSED